MKVSEFKEWLSQFPDDTEVKIYSALGKAGWLDFDGVNFTETSGENWDFVDYTKNPRITKEEHPNEFGNKVLYLGEY